LNQVGLRALAAGAACVAGFVSYLWLTDDSGAPAVESRAPAALAAEIGASTVAESPVHANGPARLVSLQAGDGLPIAPQRTAPELNSATSSFTERFVLDRSPSSAQPSVSFADRFGGQGLPSRAPVQSAAAAARTRVASAAAPSPAARAVAKAAPKQAPKSGFQLASASDTPVALAYAPADAAAGSGIPNSLKDLTPKDSDPPADVDTSHTAIYDISARTVYLPNGRRLEAHSGLGEHMDDPRSLSKRMVGVTPPNVYDLRMREARFHGVRAIRLIPRDRSKMYGRDGILAHTYMLGPSGESNGCVSFADYPAFLAAYERGEITRLVVVERLAGEPPSPKTAADWLANTLKGIFQRS
jgi:hypothetical protein